MYYELLNVRRTAINSSSSFSLHSSTNLELILFNTTKLNLKRSLELFSEEWEAKKKKNLSASNMAAHLSLSPFSRFLHPKSFHNLLVTTIMMKATLSSLCYRSLFHILPCHFYFSISFADKFSSRFCVCGRQKRDQDISNDHQILRYSLWIAYMREKLNNIAGDIFYDLLKNFLAWHTRKKSSSLVGIFGSIFAFRYHRVKIQIFINFAPFSYTYV